MRSLLRILAYLYPAAWRKRYGRELEALIEDARPSIGGAFDLLKGALVMQLGTVTPVRVLMTSAIVGVMVAFAIVASKPEQWSSTAVIQTTPSAQREGLRDRAGKASQSVLSRAALVTILRDSGVYQDLLKDMTAEDVVPRLRENIQVQIMDQGAALRVRFSYHDPRLAQMVTQSLAARFVEADPASFKLVELANLPGEPMNGAFASKVAFVGLGGGLFIGGPIAALLYWRRRKRG